PPTVETVKHCRMQLCIPLNTSLCEKTFGNGSGLLKHAAAHDEPLKKRSRQYPLYKTDEEGVEEEEKEDEEEEEEDDDWRPSDASTQRLRLPRAAKRDSHQGPAERCVGKRAWIESDQEEDEWNKTDGISDGAAIADFLASCDRCEKKFTTGKGLKRHSIVHDGVRCTVCNKKLTKERLPFHMDEIHSQSVKEETRGTNERAVSPEI
ncbi:hypothetical protein PENTCL1PPCAC_27109, partial [Pristionchus entomophagus]